MLLLDPRNQLDIYMDSLSEKPFRENIFFNYLILGNDEAELSCEIKIDENGVSRNMASIDLSAEGIISVLSEIKKTRNTLMITHTHPPASEFKDSWQIYDGFFSLQDFKFIKNINRAIEILHMERVPVFYLLIDIPYYCGIYYLKEQFSDYLIPDLENKGLKQKTWREQYARLSYNVRG